MGQAKLPRITRSTAWRPPLNSGDKRRDHRRLGPRHIAVEIAKQFGESVAANPHLACWRALCCGAVIAQYFTECFDSEVLHHVAVEHWLLCCVAFLGFSLGMFRFVQNHVGLVSLARFDL